MSNEEIIEILKGKLEYYNSSLAEYYDEELINALEEANKKIKENTKLKAEIERLKNEKNPRVIIQTYEKEIDQLKSELEQSVKLPYLAGTPLYFAFSKQGIVKDKIRRWQINEHGILFCSKGSAYPVDFIGKYAFLTREEAERSLKGQV